MTFGDRPSIRIRQKLLAKIRHEVHGHLSQSLYHRVLSSLSREPNPLQVQRPGDIQVKISGSATSRLDATTSPFNLFDRTGGVWVVLGNAGSGKTSTLLELAYEAIARAETYGHQPIPLLFDLARWQRKTFLEWLVEQCSRHYQLSRSSARKWIREGKILPILDNLDSLSSDRQNQTLQAIKELQTTLKSPLNLILGARIDSYKRCPTRLKLQGAIWLKPLNAKQIEDYLVRARSRELWNSLREDMALIALARTPLFLNLMTLADEEILIHAWQRIADSEQRYRYLLNAYLRRILSQNIPEDERRWYGKKNEPRPEETKHWLIALAKWMQTQNITRFTVVQLNSLYLQTPEQKRHYQVAVGMVTGILLGILCGGMAALIAVFMEGLALGTIAGLILAVMIIVAIVLKVSLGAIKNAMLHHVLRRYDLIPWNFSRFLNYAASKGFLQRFGSNRTKHDCFQFPHELIQEHFAQIEEFKF